MRPIGSAAGSIIPYCLGITTIDPIAHDLTFERFLNPERVQMPDIDMDFADSRREEVIEYVANRYWRDHVAQIVTFGARHARPRSETPGSRYALQRRRQSQLSSFPRCRATHDDRSGVAESPQLKSLYDDQGGRFCPWAG